MLYSLAWGEELESEYHKAYHYSHPAQVNRENHIHRPEDDDSFVQVLVEAFSEACRDCFSLKLTTTLTMILCFSFTVRALASGLRVQLFSFRPVRIRLIF